MKFFSIRLCFIIILMTCSNANSQVALEGYFIARQHCPAMSSLHKATNPGNLFTTPQYAYDLIGKNKDAGTHYQVRIGEPPELRWVSVQCGEHVVPVSTVQPTPAPPEKPKDKNKDYVLAVSWQAAFCETRPGKPECQSQTMNRYDATHLALHGLWPQPRSNIYCGVPSQIVSIDKDKRWKELPPLNLEEATRADLNRVMPGAQSYLHRHEWIKHGTCYHRSEQAYMQDSTRLMDALNRSGVRDLFAENIGKTITARQIQEAFEEAFGNSAGDKIKVSCAQDGKRRLIKEITIGLAGDLATSSFQAAMEQAKKVDNPGCNKGIVDPVGFQ